MQKRHLLPITEAIAAVTCADPSSFSITAPACDAWPLPAMWVPQAFDELAALEPRLLDLRYLVAEFIEREPDATPAEAFQFWHSDLKRRLKRLVGWLRRFPGQVPLCEVVPRDPGTIATAIRRNQAIAHAARQCMPPHELELHSQRAFETCYRELIQPLQREFNL